MLGAYPMSSSCVFLLSALEWNRANMTDGRARTCVAMIFTISSFAISLCTESKEGADATAVDAVLGAMKETGRTLYTSSSFPPPSHKVRLATKWP